MKEYMQKKWGEKKELPERQELKRQVQEAWESIEPAYLLALIESMPKRIQAVIDAEGGHTKY
jgi:hypothetical protein